MNDDFTQTEKIIRYLDGDLDEPELSAFTAELASNDQLQQELESIRVAKSAVSLYGLKTAVNQVHKEMRPRHRTVTMFTRNALRVAASVIFIILSFGIYEYHQLSPGRLYDDTYKPYSAGATRGEPSASLLVQAYDDMQYEKVITLYTSLDSPSVKDDFLAGQSYLELGLASKAITAFEMVLEKNRVLGTATFHDDAEYYLALSYLKNNNVEKALQLFTIIKNNSDHLYHDKVYTTMMWRLRLLNWKQ